MFALWGGFAQTYASQISEMAESSGTESNVVLLYAPHPSRGEFFENNPLAAINDALTELQEQEIEWLGE